jgi:Aldo/keto reductase family
MTLRSSRSPSTKTPPASIFTTSGGVRASATPVSTSTRSAARTELRAGRRNAHVTRAFAATRLDSLGFNHASQTNPRFTEGNFEQNLRIIDEVKDVASEHDATRAQVALAWLLAQGDDIAPIPGTKRVSRIEENTAADRIELTAGQIERLGDLAPAVGDRHDEANMAAIDR